MRPIEVPQEVIKHYNGKSVIAKAPVGSMSTVSAPAMVLTDDNGRPTVMFLVAIEPAEAELLLQGRAIWLGFHTHEVPIWTMNVSEVEVKFE